MQTKDEPARETLHITQTSAEYDVWTIEKYLRLAHPTIVHRGVFVMSRLDDSSKRPRQKRHVNEGGDDGMGIPTDGESGFPLLHIDERYHNFDDLIVTDETKDRLMSIVLECAHAKRLLAFGFSPESKILLCGPPGTGKTLSARVISSEIGYPFAYVHFDSIVSSLLGQTATNLRKIFDFINAGRFVVLFDEFDIVGKKRDDPHEHGEIKRVVNNFMQMLDRYDGPSIILAATNHQHLLDKAVWRRFDDVVYFDLPDGSRREQLFAKYLRVMNRELGVNPGELAEETPGYSAADIAQTCENALKRSIMENSRIVLRTHMEWAIGEQRRRMKIITGEDNRHYA